MSEEVTNAQRLETLQQILSVGVSPSRGLDHLTEDVRAFHLLFGHPAPTKPQAQDSSLVARRAKWILSELDELTVAKTVHEQADAYLDIIYFAVGGLVELGIRFSHRLWRLVQGANLAKIWPDGSIRKNEAGKVQKPDGWVAPDEAIRASIEEEAASVAMPQGASTDAICIAGDAVVQQLSLATGGHVHILLFAVDEEGLVMSTSNMLLEDQRDFLRYVNQSLSSGGVLVQEHETKQ
jgi:predicted HAD superfamily Cof-like phosphohydrolase